MCTSKKKKKTKRKKAQAGNDCSNILPKSLQTRKKPPPALGKIVYQFIHKSYSPDSLRSCYYLQLSVTHCVIHISFSVYVPWQNVCFKWSGAMSVLDGQGHVQPDGTTIIYSIMSVLDSQGHVQPDTTTIMYDRMSALNGQGFI